MEEFTIDIFTEQEVFNKLRESIIQIISGEGRYKLYFNQPVEDNVLVLIDGEYQTYQDILTELSQEYRNVLEYDTQDPEILNLVKRTTLVRVS